MKHQVLIGIRKRMHLTQRQFGQLVGVRGPMVSQWESGKYPVSWEKAVKISNIFGGSPVRLFIENRQKPNKRRRSTARH